MSHPTESETAAAAFLPRAALDELFRVLQAAGYQIVGPRIEQGAIIYDHLDRAADLPQGWTDQQGPGLYRLQKRDDQAVFGYAVGPHSWKRFLFPPQVDLMKSRRTESGWQMEAVESPPPRFAFLGVRACELAAIAIQDRVFITPAFADSVYQQRREQALIIAVNCTTAAETCFCTSMGTGPRCTTGYDLGLTEVEDGFMVEIATDLGRTIADQLPLVALESSQAAAADAARQQCVASISRRFDQAHVQARLKSQLQHPRWDDVADRCLSCANCTMVCPTCFCTSVDDVTNLTDEEVLRQRRWDSCFNFDFSHLTGGPVRDQTRSRYRQWLTHKLTHWMDQFGTAGCVGCGRCIAWCPVGIDLTVEATALCSDDPTSGPTVATEAS
jgi:formate hydrogenlyase subunit 6/NADH:ubiquinone oxidoreductase subunit I